MRRLNSKKLAAVLLSVCLAASQGMVSIPVYAQGSEAGIDDIGYGAEDSAKQPIQNQVENRVDIATDSNASQEQSQPEVPGSQSNANVSEHLHHAHNGKSQITDWEWIDPDYTLKDGVLALPGVNQINQASFDKVVSLLPKKISVTVTETATDSNADEEQVLTLSHWACKTFQQDEDGDWPVQGDYIFSASMPKEYTLAPAANPLEIKVVLGGANTLGASKVNEGDFTLTSDSPLSGKDYEYSDNTLTIKSNTPITISGTTTSDHIVVKKGITANITLGGVDIQFHDGDAYKPGTCAFEVPADATCNLILADGSTNALASGWGKAGLQVPTGAVLTIAGTGSLTANGGTSGAGIGGTYGADSGGGSITISGGTVTANGIGGGAGIGGGYNGYSGTIIISGGTVTANGSNKGAAGIGGGGGYNGDGRTITISGGTVTANGNEGGAGIGGGRNGMGGAITISGGTVTANSSGGIRGNGGAGIGGGGLGNGGTIAISGGTVTAYGSNEGGAGIGGGDVGDGGTIAISGGIVTANGNGGGAGIGGGDNGIGNEGVGDGGTIAISGGTVTAYGNGGGAGIGGGHNGKGGTFSTGGSGNAFIVASSISDNINPGSWNGVIFEGNDGLVYGKSTTLTADAEIPSGKVLTIDSENSLTISSGKTLTNSGTIINNGTFQNDGTIQNNGTINNSGSITGNAVTGSPITTGAFAVAGESLNYSYDNSTHVLTIQNGANLTIRNTDPNTPTTDIIVVASGAVADLTLSSVNIDVSSADNTSAFEVAGNATCNLTLADGSTNTLTSGRHQAGLQVQENAALIIAETGSLTANGGDGGSGIGGGYHGKGGTITISGGDVKGNGYLGGAGIGGGSNGVGGTIAISGGNVMGNGNGGGAGIGDGDNGVGGTIAISGGNVKGNGYFGGAGIGGGDNSVSGTIVISGGTVVARSVGDGAGIGTGKNGTGSTFSTGGSGNAFIVASSISDNGKPGSWHGVIFDGNNGKIYGSSITMTTNAVIPRGRALTIESGKTLTIESGKTLTNLGTITISTNGAINNNSTINNTKGTIINKGTITGNPVSGGTVQSPAVVTVTFSKDSADITSAAYGNTITITAKAEAVSDRKGLTRSAPESTVNFYLGDVSSGTKLNSDPIPLSSGAASLPVTLTGAQWMPNGSPYTITADFGGTSGSLGLLANTGTAGLTVTKIIPSAPTQPGGEDKTSDSITVNTVTGQKYICTTSDSTPDIGGLGWIDGTDSVFTFTGLTRNTTYYIWTYAVTADDTHSESAVSSALSVTTEKEPISSVDIAGITAPVSAGTPDGNAENGDHWTAGPVTWYQAGSGQLHTGAFAYAASYTAKVTLTAAEGYEFTDSVTAQMDGSAAAATNIGGNTVTVSYTFPVTQSSGSSDQEGVTTPEKPDVPITETVTVIPEALDQNGSVSIPDEQVANAINEAAKAARKNGQTESGVVIAVNLPMAATDAALDRATLDRLMTAGAKSFKLNFNDVNLSFDLPALKEMAGKSAGTLTIGASKASGFTGDALTAIGSRPAYSLAVSWPADGKTDYLDSFGAGSVAVAMDYTPAADELTGSLYAVYVDGSGKVEWLDQSSYDRNSRAVIFKTGHFSTFGVGCKASPAFTDTANHWAKADIDFVAARGLLSGTGNGQFSPDADMTHGMFTAALGRLAGITPTDAFSPDMTISREQMAVIMVNYAKAMGYTVPKTRESVTFADNGSIGYREKDAVKAMQMAGILNGKDANHFDPKGTVTRAEAAAVLHKYVELVIDPDTAQGWTQNDTGQWLYYENGKPDTGWKTVDGKWYYLDAAGIMQSGGWKQIGGKWYYLYADGSMAVKTKIDGYEAGPDGARL